jgi:predicted GIY-YIG superfamily endonuclease
MASGQQMLFPPEKPLVKRLGRTFFLKIPQQAGVYKMHDSADKVVYVGKAKDLRQRLANYRVAHPERLGRRHLRLLHAVTRIEFELCENEAAALKHEAKLIRELKPKFNRAGVWQGRPQFLTWRCAAGGLELTVQETPLTGWERFGSLGAHAPRLTAVLTGLLWRTMNVPAGYERMPHGWMQNRMPELTRIECAERLAEVQTILAHAFWGDAALFLSWLARGLNQERPAFERTAIAADVEELEAFFEQQARPQKKTGQMALL